MEISKITEKYNLYKEGEIYIIELGDIKRAEDNSVEVRLTQLEDSSKITIHPKCGCTVPSYSIVSQSEMTIKLAYQDCESSFSKVTEIRYKNNTTVIKIKGRCQ